MNDGDDNNNDDVHDNDDDVKTHPESFLISIFQIR
jgi:hypothetical protein